MLRGFVVSLLLHAAVLAWALVSFQLTPELRMPDVQPISVSIITPSELTRIKEGDPDAKELEAKESDKPKTETSKQEAPKPKPVTAPPPAAEPPPPPPEEAKAEPPPKPEPPKPEPPKSDPIADKIAALPPPKPEPEPGPTPEEKKAQEEKAEQERQAAEQKKAEEQRKAEEQKRKEAERRKRAEELKKKREHEKKLAEKRERDRKLAEERKKKQFDVDRIAALIDKSPDKRGAPPSATAPPTRPTTHTGPTAGERGGKDSTLSAREQDMLAGMLKAQIAACWRLPGAGAGAENPVVTLRWRLRTDGSLDGEPQVARPAAGPMAGLATEAAIRAVKTCSPFKLPAEHYAGWKDVEWTFDPSKML